MSEAGLIQGLVESLPRPGVAASAEGGELDEAKLLAVLGAARVAPSADNAQTWRFITVREEDTKAKLEGAVDPAVALSGHAAIVAVCGIQWVVTRTRREQPFVFMDVPIALSHILLQSAELGLSCTWTLDVDEPAVRAILGIPEDVRVVALVGLS